jgi:hypothetical protein
MPTTSAGTASTLSAASFNGVDWYTPVFLYSSMLFDQAAVEVSTGDSGTNMRFGMYRASRLWQPQGAPVFDSGDISLTATGVKTYTPGSPILVRPGRYLTVLNSNSSAAALRAYLGVPFTGQVFDTGLGSSGFITGFTVSRAFAAFPTPGTAWTAGTAANRVSNMVVFKLADAA